MVLAFRGQFFSNCQSLAVIFLGFVKIAATLSDISQLLQGKRKEQAVGRHFLLNRHRLLEIVLSLGEIMMLKRDLAKTVKTFRGIQTLRSQSFSDNKSTLAVIFCFLRITTVVGNISQINKSVRDGEAFRSQLLFN